MAADVWMVAVVSRAGTLTCDHPLSGGRRLLSLHTASALCTFSWSVAHGMTVVAGVAITPCNCSTKDAV